jgi:nucleotide-binding universal stress UspA family protein
MGSVVVPVRYPLSEHSEATLETAIRAAEERDATLTVLHVDLYQSPGRVNRRDLKTAVEAVHGRLPRTRYVVRPGLIVEETLLDEILALDADVVVIGEKQSGPWRRLIRRLAADPDIEQFLRRELDCEVVTAPT